MFLDPPYDLPAATVDRELAALSGGWLAPDAYVVLERSARTPAVAWPEGIELDVSRDYGETRMELAIWQDRAS